MSDSQEPSSIPIWVILVDEEFVWRTHSPNKLRIEKTTDIEDMKYQAVKQFKLNLGPQDVEILKILSPLPPDPKHSYNLRSISQQDALTTASISPQSLTELLDQLRAGNKQFVHHPSSMDAAFSHFEEKQGLIQAIVIVKSPVFDPTVENKKRKREESSTAQVKAPLLEHLNNIVTGSPPSDTLGEHGVKLRRDVLFGRPAGQFALPVALYNQHLARLQYKLTRLNATLKESNVLFKDADAYLEISRQFLEAAIDDHETEESRWTASKSYFETLFGLKLVEQFRIPRAGRASNANAQPAAKADACVITTLDGKDGKIQIPYFFFEFKKEKGLGDPIAQCAKANAESVYGFRHQPFFFSTYFPTVFACLNGHSFEISTSVSLEYIVVDNILQLDLRDSFQRTQTIRQLARIASTLIECSSALDVEYQQLAQQKESRHPLQPCYPQAIIHPWEDSSALPLPKLEFRGRLSRENQLIRNLIKPAPSDMRSLLVASMEKDQHKISVVVKFTENYGQEAHVILARENLAPEFYDCRRVLGDMFMVIMEYLEGWQPMEQFKKGELPHSIFEDIEKALEKLHKNDYVHGDLRAVNIMIDPTKQHAKIVDFDWAAKEGESQYSPTINKAALENEWHPDVCGGGKIIIEHDKYALNKVLKLKYK